MFLRIAIRPLLRNHSALVDCSSTVITRPPILAFHKKSNKTSITKSNKTEHTDVGVNVEPLGRRVTENVKTASYIGVIMVGFALTGTFFYVLFTELFSSKSSNNVYSKAAKICRADPRVQDSLGLPIKAFGEETTRGRRRHVSYVLYEKNGRNCMRMRFYLQGKFKRATVHLDVQENDSGDYQYQYLIVEVDDLLRSIIVLEDNRNVNPSPVSIDL